jgi:hypothetical protein
MKSLWIATLVLVANGLGQNLATPQPTTSPNGVTIRERVVASADLADSPHVEPRLASDPNNPSRLLIGAMLFRRDGGGDSECTALASSDAGRTWRRGVLPKQEGVTGGGDPWVGFDHAGTAFLSCMHGIRTATGERTSGVGVYRSTDGGASWMGPAMLPGRAYDRPVLVVDPRSQATASTIHVVASQSARRDFGPSNPIAISTSNDGGRTFSEPVQVLFNNLNNNVRSAVTLSDGSLAVVFFDVGALDGRRLEQFRVWMIRSSDGGRTFGPALFVNENPGGDQVDVAVGPTGKLFAAWDVVRGPREARGVFFSSSDDGGRRWSQAMRLADLSPGEKHQHVPTVASDDGSTVATMWVDYRNDPRSECSELYFRASLNAAWTWMAPVPLSSKPSCPRSPSNTIVRPDGKPNQIDRRWTEGGDYHGLIAAGQGKFQAVWSDSSTGVFQIHFAVIDVSGVPPTDKVK